MSPSPPERSSEQSVRLACHTAVEKTGRIALSIGVWRSVAESDVRRVADGHRDAVAVPFGHLGQGVESEPAGVGRLVVTRTRLPRHPATPERVVEVLPEVAV